MPAPSEKFRVLLLEDEILVLLALEGAVEDFDCEVAFAAANVADALRFLADHDVDAALLDVNVAGVRSDAVAETLLAKHIPFAFLTGYGARGIDARFADAPVIVKPYSAPDVHAALRTLLQIA